jgi:hypothetical protein
LSAPVDRPVEKSPEMESVDISESVMVRMSQSWSETISASMR